MIVVTVFLSIFWTKWNSIRFKMMNFRFLTKWNSNWIKIERKTATTITSHSIWKEIYFSLFQAKIERKKCSFLSTWCRETSTSRTAVDSPALYIYTYINILHCTLFIFFIFLGNNSRHRNGFPFLVRRDANLTALTILPSYAHKEIFLLSY